MNLCHWKQHHRSYPPENVHWIITYFICFFPLWLRIKGLCFMATAAGASFPGKREGSKNQSTTNCGQEVTDWWFCLCPGLEGWDHYFCRMPVIIRKLTVPHCLILGYLKLHSQFCSFFYQNIYVVVSSISSIFQVGNVAKMLVESWTRKVYNLSCFPVLTIRNRN
jgi:hypothetical protein